MRFKEKWQVGINKCVNPMRYTHHKLDNLRQSYVLLGDLHSRRFPFLFVLTGLCLLAGCSRTPVVNIDLLDIYETAILDSETTGITFANDPTLGSLVSGFAFPEKDSSGRSFVWGIGKVSVVEPFITAKSDRYLTVAMQPFNPAIIGPQKVQVVWNGTMLDEFTMTDLKWNDYRLKVPAEIQEEGPNRLEFHFEKTVVPAEVLKENTDRRELNVMFDALVLETDPGFRSGSPVPTNVPVLEKRGDRKVLAFGGPGVLNYCLKVPAETRLSFRWRRESKDSSEAKAPLVVRWSSGTMDRTLYQAGNKDGKKDWVKVEFPIPESKEPARIRLISTDSDFLVSGLSLSCNKDVELSDLFPIDTSLPEKISTVAAPAKKPNLIFFLIDTLRADHIGAYGYGRPTTPCLDEIAKEGILYESTFAHNSWTKNSMAAVMTGRHPSSCLVTGQDDALPGSAVTLAEVLSEAGYYCAAFSSNGYISEDFGFDQGFQEFQQFRERPDSEGIHVQSEELYGAVAGELDKLAGKEPFFLYIHSTDPHAPYTPPPDFRKTFDSGARSDVEPTIGNIDDARLEKLKLGDEDIQRFIDLYDAEITSNDAQLKSLLDKLGAKGLLENSIIVVTSDHGEEFLEHGGLEHSRTLYEEVLHVPLIMKIPGGPQPVRISERVRHIDLFPTLTALCGAENPVGLEGCILPMNTKDASDRPHFAELPIMGMSSYTTGDRKVIVNVNRKDFRARPLPYVEMYNTQIDTKDRIDLAGRDVDQARYLAAGARILQTIYTDRGRQIGNSEKAVVSEEQTNVLRQLNYVK